MKAYTERLGSAPLGKLLIALSLPGIASSVTTTLYNVVDTLWVSQLGHQALAALTIVFPYQIIMYAIGGGTGIGVSALVSRRFGERNIEETNRVAAQILLISAFWGLLFILAASFFAGDIVRLIGATPDIIEYARQYLLIVSFGAPLVIFAIIFGSLLRGSGDAVKPMIIMIVSTVINIVLDPLMILGIGPFPEMGVRGAALATVIAQGGGVLLCFYYFFRQKTAFHLRFAQLRPNMRITKDVYRVGAPASILQITESFAFMLFNTVLSSFGSLAIAAAGIAFRISDFAFMPVLGVSYGLLPIVGFCYGERNYKRLWRSVKLASLGIVALLVVITTLIEIFAPQIVSVFSKDTGLIPITVPVMRIMLCSMPLIGPSIMFVTAFQGLNKGKTALGLSLIRQFIVFVPLMYLFRHLFAMYGVYWSMPVSDSFGILVSLGFIISEYRIHKKRGLMPPSQA
jgi:putative MATE family efflux protein